MRKIHIVKESGKTIVTIQEDGNVNSVAYTLDADIHLYNNFIAVVKNEIPFLTFTFDEVENPQTATNIAEYHNFMLENNFFSNDSVAINNNGGGLPIDHTHTMNQITGLQTALFEKANVNHTHTIPQVTGLQTALNGKADVNHTHVVNWDDIQNKPSLSVGQHKHAIEDVTGLQEVLNGKADTNHTHVINWNDIQNKPNEFTPSTHTHVIADVTNLQQTLNNKADVDHTHTFNWSNLETTFELKSVKFNLTNQDKSKYLICNANNMSVTINANDLTNGFECIIDNPHRHIVTISVNGNVLGSTHGLTAPYTLAKGGSVFIYKFNNQLYIKGDVI